MPDPLIGRRVKIHPDAAPGSRRGVTGIVRGHWTNQWYGVYIEQAPYPGWVGHYCNENSGPPMCPEGRGWWVQQQRMTPIQAEPTTPFERKLFNYIQRELRNV